MCSNCSLDIEYITNGRSPFERYGDVTPAEEQTLRELSTILPIPKSEHNRLQTLRETNLLDSNPNEPEYDRFTKMCQRIFKTSIATLSLVDMKRQWFKSRVGLEPIQTPRVVAFCAHTIMRKSGIMVVADASKDPRFMNNPLVTGAPNIRFYAGAAIICEGYKIGTLCVIDTKPRFDFNENDQKTLINFAQILSDMITQRRKQVLQNEKDLAELCIGILYTIKQPLQNVLHKVEEIKSTINSLQNLANDSVQVEGAKLTEEEKDHLQVSLHSQINRLKHFSHRLRMDTQQLTSFTESGMQLALTIVNNSLPNTPRETINPINGQVMTNNTNERILKRLSNQNQQPAGDLIRAIQQQIHSSHGKVQSCLWEARQIHRLITVDQRFVTMVLTSVINIAMQAWKTIQIRATVEDLPSLKQDPSVQLRAASWYSILTNVGTIDSAIVSSYTRNTTNLLNREQLRDPTTDNADNTNDNKLITKLYFQLSFTDNHHQQQQDYFDSTSEDDGEDEHGSAILSIPDYLLACTTIDTLIDRCTSESGYGTYKRDRLYSEDLFDLENRIQQHAEKITFWVPCLVDPVSYLEESAAEEDNITYIKDFDFDNFQKEGLSVIPESLSSQSSKHESTEESLLHTVASKSEKSVTINQSNEPTSTSSDIYAAKHAQHTRPTELIPSGTAKKHQPLQSLRKFCQDLLGYFNGRASKRSTKVHHLSE